MSVRRAIKRIGHGAAALTVAPAVLAARAEARLGGGDALYVLFAEALALVPGLPGAMLRAAYYAGTLGGTSWETHVGFGSLLCKRGASLGRHASIGRHCVLGDAAIGASAMIGSRVSVPSGKRQHLDDSGRLSQSVARFERVTIGDGCWIGDGAVVMADLGAGCIVAAGAVVTHPVPAGAWAGGNPARVLRTAGSGTPSGAGSDVEAATGSSAAASAPDASSAGVRDAAPPIAATKARA